MLPTGLVQVVGLVTAPAVRVDAQPATVKVKLVSVYSSQLSYMPTTMVCVPKGAALLTEITAVMGSIEMSPVKVPSLFSIDSPPYSPLSVGPVAGVIVVEPATLTVLLE